MNYTDIITRFWRLDEECPFTPAETRMYLQLLDIFSRVGFDRPVTMANTLATGLFGISLAVYKNACKDLIDRGLITVEIKTIKRRHCAVFRLADPTAESPTQTPDPATVHTSTDTEDTPGQIQEPEAAEAKPVKASATPAATVSDPQCIRIRHGVIKRISAGTDRRHRSSGTGNGNPQERNHRHGASRRRS